MEPWLPSYRDGVLTLPSIPGHASLVLTRHESEVEDWLRFSIEISFSGSWSQVLSASRTCDHWATYATDLRMLWSSSLASETPVQAASFEQDARFQLQRGLLLVELGVDCGSPYFTARASVLVEEGQWGRVADMWQTFFTP